MVRRRPTRRSGRSNASSASARFRAELYSVVAAVGPGGFTTCHGNWGAPPATSEGSAPSHCAIILRATEIPPGTRIDPERNRAAYSSRLSHRTSAISPGAGVVSSVRARAAIATMIEAGKGQGWLPR